MYVAPSRLPTSAVSYRSSAGQEKFAGQRPALSHATNTIELVGHSLELRDVDTDTECKVYSIVRTFTSCRLLLVYRDANVCRCERRQR